MLTFLKNCHIMSKKAKPDIWSKTVSTIDQIDLPDFFKLKLEESYSHEDIARILEGSNVNRKVSLRANAILSSREEIAASLDESRIEWADVRWYEDAFLITQANEKAIWSLDAYSQGKLYMQSLSSMIPPLVLDPKPELDILDMCAAPGGKTTQISALGGRNAHITACEMNAPRAEKLRFNLNKQGATNVMVMQEDARRLSEYFRFDKILIDAPCSGSGTLKAGDPKVFKRFTPKLLEKCTKSQRALLAKGLSLLKPGGTLVYSTCSVFPEENEQQVLSALNAVKKIGSYAIEDVYISGFEDIPRLPCSIEGAMTICPTAEYEGFFACKIKRKA